DVVLTAGGTGMTVDDVTPEATLDVCDRQVPGIAEALRQASQQHTHAWPLSRGVAGARGRTLVVNLPGTPTAAAEAEPVLAPVLGPVVRLLRRCATAAVAPRGPGATSPTHGRRRTPRSGAGGPARLG